MPESSESVDAPSPAAFAHAARLAAIRSSSAAADDPAVIEALAADANSWTAADDATTRTEARLLCAEAYAGRLHHPELAIALERAVASDVAAPAASRAYAAREAVDADLDRGDLGQARADASTYAALFDAKALRRLQSCELRRSLSWAAGAELGIALGLALFAFARRARLPNGRKALWTNAARSAARAASVAAFVAFVGGGLAYAYDASDPRPFLALGAAIVILAAITGATRGAGASSGGAGEAASWRAARAVLGAGAVVAAAFLLLQWIDASYLAGFGL